MSSRECNQQLKEIPMRVLQSTRQGFINYLIKENGGGLFHGKKRKPETEKESSQSIHKITTLILEYEDISQESYISPQY